jgi:hypothetical protein
MLSPPTCRLVLCFGEFLYVHLEDGLPGFLWRLLRPTFGLVESGRLWQLAIEK